MGWRRLRDTGNGQGFQPAQDDVGCGSQVSNVWLRRKLAQNTPSTIAQTNANAT